MTDTALPFASIAELARLYRKRKLSPVEVTRLMLARIEKLNPKLNAYLTVTSELALAQAKKSEAELFAGKSHRDRGPLHGVPISLKDNIYTNGIRTTAGSKILKNFVPDHDAAVWSNLKEAGAILLGKTNLHEFAYGVTTNNPHFGPTRNPWDLARIPGGSSGGSAAAVAAGLCYASIGTDTGGSIRIPAALCGIVGFKPTLHRVSVDGVLPLSATLDCVGPLARTTADAALIFEIIRIDPSRKSKSGKLASKSSNFTLGIPREFFFDVISAEVQKAFDAALQSLRKLGIKTKPVSIPLMNETEDAGNQIAWPEATRYHLESGWYPARAADYSEDVRTRVELGTKVSAITYLQALEKRDQFIRQFHAALENAGVDALAVSTTPIPAPLIGEEQTTVGATTHPTRALLLRLNRPANLAGIPAISILSGVTNAALPVGLQIIGAANSDSLLLRIAAMFENANPNLAPPKV